MTHLARAFWLCCISVLLAACGAPFTAGFSPSGMSEADAGEAGASDPGVAGAAGSSAGAAAAGAAGSPSAGATSGGAASGGSAGLGAAGAAGAPPAPHCEHPVDVSGGYYSGGDTCYRTREAFDLVLCGSWGERALKINGKAASCNARVSVVPDAEGFTYFEVSGPSTGSGWIRWLTYTAPVPCDNPITATSTQIELTGQVTCIRTTEVFNEVDSSEDVPIRYLVLNGFQTGYNAQTGVPPAGPDGYSYISVGPGLPQTLTLRSVPMGPAATPGSH